MPRTRPAPRPGDPLTLRRQLQRGFLLLLTLLALTALTSLQFGRVPTLVVGALSLACGIAVMQGVTRSVLLRVGGEPAELAAVIEQVANGDLEVEVGGESGIAASVAQMTATLRDVSSQANAIARGDYSADIAPRSGKDELGIALQAMTAALRAAHDASTKLDWLKSGLARLSEALSGDPDVHTLANRAVSEIAQYLGAQLGVLYVAQDDQRLALYASYAYVQRKNLSSAFRLGEGLVGQAALEKQQILIRNVPDDYVRVTSGLGERAPRCLCVTPLLYETRVKGVLEIGMLDDMAPEQLEYLSQAVTIVAIAFESAQARVVQATLLGESRRLTEELQGQQEELRTANEELEQQSQRLRESEERLRQQQEELEVTNEELLEKNEQLERQKRDVEHARAAIGEKADELALASKYKSEFLANMSHELRTPLNSLLILAQSLEQNRDGNLTPDQVEAVRVIRSSGSDLLTLINEILDLSKIEAGRMDLHVEAVRVADLADSARASFDHMARMKGLTLDVVIGDDAPREVASDRKRIEQVLRNLVSNAIKFTESGSVALRFDRPARDVSLERSGLVRDRCLAIAVRDTGIGIAPDKHKLVFEAFQQADGGTSRRYGGTGLGLTISRELATLMGGEIQLESEPGRGSVFTLYLPIEATNGAGKRSDGGDSRPSTQGTGGASTATQATTPAAPALVAPAATAQDAPDASSDTPRRMLVVEDDPTVRRRTVGLLEELDAAVDEAATGAEAIAALRHRRYACVVLDLSLPDMDGVTLLATLTQGRLDVPPVIVHTSRELTLDEERALREHADSIVIKDVRSPERLLDEVSLLLQRLERESAAPRRKALRGLHDADALLRDKKILVVDDDMRTTFAISRLLTERGMRLLKAENGKRAVELLSEEADVDLVLMDIMMPVMDGYAAMQAIRAQERFRRLPIIALTAKAMPEDRAKCIDAGASDYLTKPVDTDRLFSMMRVWLYA